MRIDWGELMGALALFFVLEGIAPFLNPSGMRRALSKIAELGDRELRLAGLGSMVVGVLLLFFVRS